MCVWRWRQLSLVTQIQPTGTNRIKTNHPANGLYKVIDPRVRLIYIDSKKTVSCRWKDFTNASFILYKPCGLGSFFKHQEVITPLRPCLSANALSVCNNRWPLTQNMLNESYMSLHFRKDEHVLCETEVFLQ